MPSALRQRLSQWSLRRNPFPSVPYVDPFNTDELRNGSVFAADIRHDEIERFRTQVLHAGYAADVKPWAWVFARRRMGKEMGTGKTAFLVYIADQINRDYGHHYFNQAAHWLAVYVPTAAKWRTADDTVVAGLESFCSDARGTSVERLLLGRLRKRAVMKAKAGAYASAVAGASEKNLMNDSWLQSNGVDLNTLGEAIERDLRERQVSAHVSHALATGTLHAYLVDLAGTDDLVAAKPGFRARAINILLNDVARAAEVGGIQHVTFLVDDFYHIVRNNSPEERKPLATRIREVAVGGGPHYYAASHNIFNWVAVMHTMTAPRFVEAWKLADMQRLAPLDWHHDQVIKLGFLAQDQKYTLLATYLAYRRPKAAPTPIHPFCEAGLQTIIRIATDRTEQLQEDCDPRDLLPLAHDVMNVALHTPLDQLALPLGQSFAEHVLEGKPLPVSTAAVDEEARLPDTSRPLGDAWACPCPCHSRDDPGAVFNDVMVRIEGNTGATLGYYCGDCNTDVAR